jgi:hypothetical protein
LRWALGEVQRGNYNAHMQIYDATELGLLQAGFNDMVRELSERQRMRDLFGRYVGEDVARRALERGTELGGQERDVAVLFVDLVGSTRLAATHPPGEVVGLLNEFSALSSKPPARTAVSSTNSSVTPRCASSVHHWNTRMPRVRHWPRHGSCTTNWSACSAKPSSGSECRRDERSPGTSARWPGSNTR